MPIGITDKGSKEYKDAVERSRAEAIKVLQRTEEYIVSAYDGERGVFTCSGGDIPHVLAMISAIIYELGGKIGVNPVDIAREILRGTKHVVKMRMK